jgi:hypothetical protein
MYRALKPIYTPWGDVFIVTWAVLGIVDSLDDAKRRFGGSPVLEAVKS